MEEQKRTKYKINGTATTAIETAQILATWRANAFLRSRSQSAAAGGSPAVGAAVPPATVVLLVRVRVRESGFC